MRSVLAVSMILFGSTVFAGPKEEAEIALALAKARSLRAVAKTTPMLDLGAAKLEAHQSGKPIFVRFGECDCSAMCEKLRPEFVTAKAPQIDGKDLFRLLMYDSKGDLWHLAEWSKTPTEAEVKSALAEGKKLLDAKK